MITKDTTSSKGKVRLENYGLSRLDRFISNCLRFFGFDHIAFIRKNGVLKLDSGFVDNMVMNAGKAAEAGKVFGVGVVAAFSYLAVGSSNTAAANTQTALGAEFTTLGLSRVLVTPTLIMTTSANDTAQLQGSWNVSGGSASIQEIGIFNAASGVTMLSRALVTNSVVSGDTLVATYTFQYL